jgi:hypothetical protein
MTRASRLAVLPIVLGTTLACRQPTAPFTDAHQSAIRDSVTAALDAFKRYSASGKWDSLAALYSSAPDFRFAESGTIQYESAASIKGALSTVPAGTRIETNYEQLRIAPLAPGVAVASGLFITRFEDSTNSGFTFSGAISMVWVHEAEGWRIRHGHSSAPVRRGP